MKKIPLLPNLLTTGNLFCGFFAIVSSLGGNFLLAAWLILAGMVFDFFDGMVARLQNSCSDFGLEYDSLSDLVSFGMAPSLLLYMMLLQHMGRIGIALGFLYVACTAMRLARFNICNAQPDKRYFLGLPSPAAAGILVSTILLAGEMPQMYAQIARQKFLPFLMILASVLMVSNVRYLAFRAHDVLSAKPFVNLVLLVVGGALVLFHLEIFLFGCFGIYLAWGMVTEVSMQHKRRAELRVRRQVT